MVVRYTVGVENPSDHWAQFRLELTGLRTPSVDLVLPSWVPGSYHLVDYVRKLKGLVARVAGETTHLSVDRVDKARWRVDLAGATAIQVEWRVYGYELITEGVDVTDQHLFVNGALCLPYVEGREDEPIDLEIHVPPEWKVYSELPFTQTHPPTVRAANYDELVDSPIECGTPVVVELSPRGIGHRILLCGPGGNYEIHRLQEDVGRIVDATIRLFGDSPLRHYTFFYHLTDRPDGGLEHATSNSAVVVRTTFRPETEYLRFLALTSHEYFHLYNVKRIRPKVFDRFDYTREMYTDLLWAMEGVTEYYANLLLRRAGLVSPKRYLTRLAGEIHRYLETPGRAVTGLEEASRIAWVDGYQPYEESRNQSVSYYLKGELVGACLDLTVRNASGNAHSLDSVWRHVWIHYGRPGKGLPEGSLAPLTKEVTGVDVSEFFQKYVTGTDEIDFAGVARLAGLNFAPKPKTPEPGDDAEPGWLGVEFRDEGGLARVATVLSGSPARRAGISFGDELVALDGVKVRFHDFPNVLKRFPAGATVDVALFRRGFLTHVPVVVGKAPPEAYVFTPIGSPTPLQQQIYESWLEAKWEPAKKTDVD